MSIPNQSAPVSILIVEDVAEMRALIQSVLEAIPGVRVSGAAENAAEARLEMLRRRPDLVFLDEILPGESSLELLESFNSVDIPVILMTGMLEPQHELPAGAKTRVEKPSWETIDEDRLRIARVIAEHLKKPSILADL